MPIVFEPFDNEVPGLYVAGIDPYRVFDNKDVTDKLGSVYIFKRTPDEDRATEDTGRD